MDRGSSAVPAEKPSASAEHLRGSSLLLAGRFIALGLGLVTEVALVRILSKADYGILALGLAIVGIGATAAALGLDKTSGRFIPIYEERGQSARVIGGVAMIVLMVGAVATLLVAALHGFQDLIPASVVEPGGAMSVVLIMAALIPAYALISVGLHLLTVFARPSEIFLRRYVAAPGLELVAVVLALVLAGEVRLVAAGYVLAALATLVIYAAAIVRRLAERDLFHQLSWASVVGTGREMLPFALPLMSTDLVFVLRSALLVVVLQAFSGPVEVAEYRAVMPIVQQNMIVLQTFAFLFTPLAARVYARGDHAAVHGLYWRSALWIALMTYPIFLGSFSLAQPVTEFLFGERYASSGPIMSILAVGFYLNAAVGLNGLTLRIYGRVRYIVMADLSSAAIGLGLSLVLIQVAGAVGAAISFSATLLAQNLLYQIGLRRIGILGRRDLGMLRIYATLGLGAIGLLIFQTATSAPLPVGVGLVGVIALGIVYRYRELLDVADVFPELSAWLRFPRRR
ncbi:MAG: oligosaccharide flippase family protein [Chloroflexi bacterium]|nr:oligosaccharide flippase family protein [Chloroflexota bacterium]